MSKQRLLFITTGGTIASVRTAQGLKPVLSSEELLAHLPELQELCCPETLALCSICLLYTSEQGGGPQTASNQPCGLLLSPRENAHHLRQKSQI